MFKHSRLPSIMVVKNQFFDVQILQKAAFSFWQTLPSMLFLEIIVSLSQKTNCFHLHNSINWKSRCFTQIEKNNKWKMNFHRESSKSGYRKDLSKNSQNYWKNGIRIVYMFALIFDIVCHHFNHYVHYLRLFDSYSILSCDVSQFSLDVFFLNFISKMYLQIPIWLENSIGIRFLYHHSIFNTDGNIRPVSCNYNPDSRQLLVPNWFCFGHWRSFEENGYRLRSDKIWARNC